LKTADTGHYTQLLEEEVLKKLNKARTTKAKDDKRPSRKKQKAQIDNLIVIQVG
jgi:hypothetical protein